MPDRDLMSDEAANEKLAALLEQFSTEDAQLARIAELERRVLDLECAIRYATYLDRERGTVHASHHAGFDLAEKVPLMREVHQKHPLKA